MRRHLTDLGLLASRFPDLAALLDAVRASPEPPGSKPLEVASAASGEPTLRLGGAFVHSGRDPEREAARAAALSRGDGPLLVLGFGLGYAAEAALALDPDRPVVVAESDPRVLDAAFRERDLSRFLRHDRLAFVVGGPPDAAASVLEAFGGTPCFLSNRALREADPAWYEGVEAAARARATKDVVNAATLRRFGRRWVGNLGANLAAPRDLPGVSRLEGRAAGFPALLVAAGPTLDDALPSLPGLARRCVVVAADTALRACLSVGVQPDFVLVVDPQYWNYRHLDRCPAPSSCLVAESASYPAVLRAPFGRAYLCSTLFPLGRYVEERVDPKGGLGAGGSVATTAWDFCRVLGARPIFAAGLDLCFPDFKTHFRGALFEGRALDSGTRLRAAETLSYAALRDGAPQAGRDAAGRPCLTDKRMSLYASWFESRFARHPEAACVRLSDRGLRLEGSRSCGIEEALALPDRRSAIDAALAAAFAEADEAFAASADERGAKWEAAVDGLARGLADLDRIAREASAVARAALEALERGDRGPADRALRALDAAGAAVAASEAKDVAGFLFPPLSELEEGLESSPGDALSRNLEISARLYGRLAEEASCNARVLASAAEKKR